ncbi:unnamed protein product, partial [Mesorhabditis spiculigera]
MFKLLVIGACVALVFTDTIDDAKAAAGDIADKAKQGLSDAGDTLRNAAQSANDKVKEGVNAAGQTLDDAKESAQDKIDEAAAQAKTAIQGTPEEPGFIDKVKGGLSSVVGFFSGEKQVSTTMQPLPPQY